MKQSTTVRWIRGSVAKYRPDPERSFALDRAVGGYHASMVSLTAGVSELVDLTFGYPDEYSDIQAAEPWYDPTRFLKIV